MHVAFDAAVHGGYGSSRAPVADFAAQIGPQKVAARFDLHLIEIAREKTADPVPVIRRLSSAFVVGLS